MSDPNRQADSTIPAAMTTFAKPFSDWIPCSCAGRSGGQVHHDESLSPAFIEALSSNPESLLDGAVILKDGDRSTVARVDDGSRRLVVKRFLGRDLFHSVVHATMRTRARWNIINSFRLHTAGIGVPSPRALREPPVGLGRTQSWFVCDFVDGTTLGELKCTKDDSELIEYAAKLFADVWQRLDRARLHHDDLKSSNLMLSTRGKLQLLDLDGMRRMLPLLHGWYRAKDRERFLRNWKRDSVEYAVYSRVVFDESTAPAHTQTSE